MEDFYRLGVEMETQTDGIHRMDIIRLGDLKEKKFPFTIIDFSDMSLK